MKSRSLKTRVTSFSTEKDALARNQAARRATASAFSSEYLALSFASAVAVKTVKRKKSLIKVFK